MIAFSHHIMGRLRLAFEFGYEVFCLQSSGPVRGLDELCVVDKLGFMVGSEEAGSMPDFPCGAVRYMIAGQSEQSEASYRPG